jgi:NAD+ kinase
MKIAYAASQTPLAQAALLSLTAAYPAYSVAEADYVVAIGGDGLVLKTLYGMPSPAKPVYAMRRTEAIGFLCNDYQVEDLPQRLSAAQRVTLYPLAVTCRDQLGATHQAHAINEVAILREASQSAKLKVKVDGIERLALYSGDGLLVATPTGSTAYNHSAGGPIMPLDANTLVMTAICGFRPRRWSYALLRQSAVVDIEVLETAKRPVRIEAGQTSISQVQSATIWLDSATSYALLFDPDQHLGERIMQEQFMA